MLTLGPGQLAHLKKFLTRLALFLAIATVLFVALDSRFASQTVESEELQFLEMQQPTIKAEVVILGSSHASVGINPKYLEDSGHKVFNFAFGGANPVFYRNWLPFFFNSYPQPKIIIYQVDWFLFRDVPYLKRRLEFDSKYLERSQVLELAQRPNTNLHDLVLNRFVIFKNRQSLSRLIWPQRGTKCSPLDLYYQGFCPTTCPTTQPGHIEVKVLEEQRLAFLEQMRDFKARKIKVIWIQSPEYMAERSFDPSYQQELDLLSQELEIPYLNYNQGLAGPPNQDRDLFVDWAHLNALGAENFSKTLSEDLKKIDLWTKN